MTNQSAKSHEVDTWPYKVFCICFAIALAAIWLWGIFVQHPITIPDGLTQDQQAEYLLQQEYPNGKLEKLLKYIPVTETYLLLAETENTHRILYYHIHPVFTSRWGLVAETEVPKNTTGTYVVGDLMDSWVVTLRNGEAGQFDIHQGIVNPTKISLWLSIAAAMAVSLVVTVPAALIRKKKRS